MKSLRRTIFVLITLSLITACYALAQPAPTPAPPEPSQAEVAETAAKEAQIEAAEEQLEAVHEQMEASREQMEAAKSTGNKTLSKLSKNLAKLRFNIGDPFSHNSTGAVLVIPTSEMKVEDLAAITEDMTVMSRIIDSQLGDKDSNRTWLSGDFLWQSGRLAEVMYLQGYGSLFIKKVDFPLSPQQESKEEEQQAKKEGADPVWEQMRRDIYEPQEDRRHRDERPDEKYDAQKVENLKTNLIKSLKHATNIRNLKPDESVIFTVTGSGVSSTLTNGVVYGTSQVVVQSKDDKSMSIVTPALPAGMEFSSPAVLIVRAKKSDIDSFSKGDLDLDKFRKKVQVFIQ